MDTSALTKLARLIRYYILTATTEAGSGHATSALSAVELGTVLFFKYLRFDLDNPKNSGNDRFILSKGHASPLLYSLFAAAGRVSEEELKTLRKFGSSLEGHPTRRFPFVEAPTGSLGQGLSIGLGMALAIKHEMGPAAGFPPSDVLRAAGKRQVRALDGGPPARVTRFTIASPRVFVLLGDGEMAEGQVWEAIELAAYYKLNNLIALVDVNRLGQSQQTMYGHELTSFAKRLSSFGWRTYLVEDGNNLEQVDEALGKAIAGSEGSQAPAAVIARTIKGCGVSFIEDKNGWHGKALTQEELVKALAELGEVDKKVRGTIQKPTVGAEVGTRFMEASLRQAQGKPPSNKVAFTPSEVEGLSKNARLPAPFLYSTSEPVATRKAFGQALVRLGQAYPELVVLDGDVKNSTYTELFEKSYPERFFEMFIAEQNMVGAALGLSSRGKLPVVATFACFLSRAADQLRMAALANYQLIFCGSHAGVSIGEDGPSQMGLEDLALFRVLPGSVVLYPADAYATERLVEEALKPRSGIAYLRTTRPATPLIYQASDKFPIGGSKVFNPQLTTHNSELVTVVAAGITLHEALKAQKSLEKEKLPVRVIDCYSVKPIDVATLKKAASETRAIIVVEDHYPEGGLGEAVKSALSPSTSSGRRVPIIHLAVYKTPRSGKASELLAYEEIDAEAIIKVVKNL